MSITAIIKMLRGTHRHPANRALHAAGLPFYAAGIVIAIGHFAAGGAGTNLFQGLALWSLAVAMFVAGHAIEGNVKSMTPVLLFRLFKRSLERNLGGKRVHIASR